MRLSLYAGMYMLSSSKEYLQALRDGKYLLFLEWPIFISEHYKMADDSQDADDTVNLIAFEWLNNGFCEEDAKKLALLSAVHDLPIRPLRGNLSYAIISLSIAVFQCMVYQNNNLQALYMSNDKMNRKQVMKFMSSKAVEKATFVDYLQIEQEKFDQWVSEADAKVVEKIFDRIYQVTGVIHCVDDYLTQLQGTDLPGDQLKPSRVSLIIRLFKYLNEQKEMTAEVKDEIAVYVNKIREMHPADFEDEYLKEISPPSFIDTTLRLVNSLSVSFFNILQPPQTPTLTSSQIDTPKV